MINLFLIGSGRERERDREREREISAYLNKLFPETSGQNDFKIREIFFTTFQEMQLLELLIFNEKSTIGFRCLKF